AVVVGIELIEQLSYPAPCFLSADLAVLVSIHALEDVVDHHFNLLRTRLELVVVLADLLAQPLHERGDLLSVKLAIAIGVDAGKHARQEGRQFILREHAILVLVEMLNKILGRTAKKLHYLLPGPRLRGCRRSSCCET